MMEEIQATKTRTGPAPGVPQDADTVLHEWLSKPDGAIPMEDARQLLGRRGFLLQEMRLGAMRSTCDWGFETREEGFDLLLPDIQETRSLGRWIALKVRLDVMDGRLAEAVRELKSGFALSRNVAQSPFFIQSLVAASIANQLVDELERLVQHPDAPNLYWALASLPTPFIDIARAAESETSMLKKEFPALNTVESSVWSVEAAREFGDLLVTKMGGLTDRWPRADSPLTKPSLHDLASHLGFMARVARDYPSAKSALSAEGLAAERLDAMPMVQVVTLDSYRRFGRVRDDLLKWLALPYWQAVEGMGPAEQSIKDDATGFPFAELLPSARGAYQSTNRLERRLSLIRTVEAIRLYAAAHDGSFPPDLAAMTDAPAPIDPTTGRPFDYKVDGEGAVLSAGSESPEFRYRIRVSR